MKSLFEYLDYRKFLADYYAFKKMQSRVFSYRFFNRKAGISSPVFLKLVIDGKRNLSLRTIRAFSSALDLNKRETTYFKNLVLFDQAKSPEEKQESYLVLRSMKNLVSEKALGADHYDYLGNWYNVVIRELVTLFDFHDDFELLAQSLRPAITAREARASVELLVRLKLLSRQEDGTYKQTASALAANEEIGWLAVRHFNRDMLLNAVKAIDELARDERHISGLSIGISPTMYKLICEEIVAFKDRIVSLVHQDDKSSGVYQLNIQLFPVSKMVEAITARQSEKQ